jgi:hypothetical protein
MENFMETLCYLDTKSAEKETINDQETSQEREHDIATIESEPVIIDYPRH